MKTKDIAFIAIFVALTIVSALFRIPLGILSITLQSFMAVLNGVMLGKKRGAIVQALYLGMGLAGLPVFSNGGGYLYVLQPSFGYLIGMVVCSFVTGLMFERLTKQEKSKPRQKLDLLIASLIGTSFIYLFGVPYQLAIMSAYLNMAADKIYVQLLNIPLFVLGDIICLVVLMLMPIPMLKGMIDAPIKNQESDTKSSSVASEQPVELDNRIEQQSEETEN